MRLPLLITFLIALKKQNEEETNATFADEALVNVIRGHLSKKGSDDLLEEDNADCDIEARNNDLDDDVSYRTVQRSEPILTPFVAQRLVGGGSQRAGR